VKRISEPKKKEVSGGCRRLHNEELYNLYASPSIIRVIKLRGMRWAGYVGCLREVRNAHKLLARNPEGKIPF